jgi:Transposase DDE domain.
MASGGYSHGKSTLRCDQIGPNPTDRAKNGTKRNMLTDAGGAPLAVVVAPANVHDTKLLDQTIEAIVVERPKPTKSNPQHLCLDKAYDNPTGEQAVGEHGYQGHIRRIGEENLSKAKKNIRHGAG